MPSSSSSSSSSSGSSSSSSASAGRGPPSQGGHGGRHSRQRGRHESGSSTRRRSRSPPRRSRSPPPHHRRRYGSPSYRGHDERHSRGGQRSRSRSRSRSSGRRRRRPEPPRPRRPTQHKLFVGGLSWTTDDAQLQDAFAVYGEVSEAKVIMDRVDPSKSRGFGFVTFTTEDAMVAAAASLNGTELDGRRITVRLEGEHAAGGGAGSGGGAGRRPKHEAFVGGLAWSTDGDSLRAAFARFGDVVDAKVVMDKDEPTKSRGFGFVGFATIEALESAVQNMDGADLGGRTIRVNKADGGGGGARGESAATAFMGTGANALAPQQGAQGGAVNEDELIGSSYTDRFGPAVVAGEEALVPSAPKEQANYGLSGKLAAETNTYKGVVLKFSEPPEARIPTTRWRLYIFKGNEPLEPLRIYKQSFYLCGRDRQVADIPTDHPSCSKQHAVIQHRQISTEDDMGQTILSIKPYVMDLESTNGTFINESRIEPRRYYELMEKDVVKFGNSTRKYVLLHPESKDSDSE